LVNGKQEKGIYEVEFNFARFTSGIYFYSFYVDGEMRITKKLILLK